MTRTQYAATAALVVYLVLLGLALLAPTSTDQAGLVTWLGRHLSDLGAPASVTDFDHLEVLMNAVIIAPVSFLGSAVLPRYRWRDWTAVGFVASLAVELVQWQLLPDRNASFSDIVANTFGALLGALLFLAVAPLVPGRRSGARVG